MNTLLNSNAVVSSSSAQSVVAHPKPYSEGIESAKELAALGEVCGQFKPYDSQLPIADIKGTRIVKCLYQVSPKTGKKLAENSYVRIPTKHLTEEYIIARISELTPYVLSYLQSVESGMIKELHSKGLLSLDCVALSMDKIIERLEESETSGRLNKEMIESWFNEYLLDSLAVSFAAKMGLDENASSEELEKIESILSAYRNKFSSLASPKVYIKESDCLAMIAVIRSEDKCASSLLGSRFIQKLGSMSEKQEELLMAL